MRPETPTSRNPKVQAAFRDRSRVQHLAPRDLIRPQGAFGTSEFDNTRLNLVPGGSRDQLIEAALCHLASLQFSQALGSWSLNGYAARSDQTPGNVSKWRRGSRPLNFGDLSRAVDLLGTGVLPDPSDVDEMLERAWSELTTQADALQPGRAARQVVREQVFTMMSLGSVPFLLVQEDYDADELAAIDALPYAAGTVLGTATETLQRRISSPAAGSVAPGSAAPGVANTAPDTASDGASDVEVSVGIDRPRYLDFGQVAGALHPSFVDLSVNLTPEWLTQVHEPGHALLDSWFVMHVAARDSTDRPTRIIVIDAETETRPATSEDPIDEPDWVFTLRFASVGWLDNTPHVTVDERTSQPTVAWLLHPHLRPTSKY